MHKHNTQARLGIDIGRVIIGGEGRGDTSFFAGDLEDSLRTPEVPGAIETITRLVQAFAGQVWLVSKCGPKVQQRTRHWLRDRQFWRRTGVLETNLRFCLERRDKALHCRQCKISHFIDDRTDVLRHLEGVVPHRYLFGPQKPGTGVPAGAVAVASWAEVARAFGLTDAPVLEDRSPVG